MQSVKRLLAFSLFLAIGFVAQSRLNTNAQTPDNKPRPSSSISGRVTIGEKPAPGVTVAAITVNYPQTILGQAVTDAEGKYRINGLAPGQANVSAVAPTMVMPASNAYIPGRTVNLSADEAVDNIDFKLTRGSVITGRVIDTDGKPVIEERIMLTLVDEKGEPSRAAMTRSPNPFSYNTDDRGIYRIYGLGAGRYKVSAGDNGGGASLRSGYYQKTYHPDTTDVARATIVELGEGSEARNIDITLGPRAHTYTVSGRIIDADTGEPLPGVDYAFGPLQPNQGQTMMAGFTTPGTASNSKGEFRLEGVAPGRFAVMTIRNSFGVDPSQLKIYSDPVPFEVTDSDVNDLELKAHRGLTVSGIVVTDAISNKAALAGISRLIVSGNNQAPPTTIQSPYSGYISSPIAADGSFQLEGLRPGKVSLSIGAFSAGESRGYTISRITSNDGEVPNRQIEIPEGRNVSGVRIYLQFGSGVLKGEVKITGGTLPADASMTVFLQTQNPSTRVAGGTVDSRGRFTVYGIPPGTYDAVLQVYGPGSGNKLPNPVHQTVTVTEDSESQISFTLDLSGKEGP